MRIRRQTQIQNSRNKRTKRPADLKNRIYTYRNLGGRVGIGTRSASTELCAPFAFHLSDDLTVAETEQRCDAQSLHNVRCGRYNEPRISRWRRQCSTTPSVRASRDDGFHQTTTTSRFSHCDWNGVRFLCFVYCGWGERDG